MATRMQIVHLDDIDGTEGASTVTFAFDGVSYEIDLKDSHKEAFAAALAPYIGVARRVAGRRGVTRKAPHGGGTSATEIRAWAQDAGLQVSSRGRVSAEIKAAYERAHS